MTHNDLCSIIESFGFELYLIDESVMCVSVSFIKPKWYRFKEKKQLNQCKSMIEKQKCVGVKFNYSWI
jgi:hypothetical protein